MSQDPVSSAPKRRSKLPLILLAIVFLAAGAGGGYWWFAHHGPSGPPPPPEPGLVAFEPFVVNLADGGGSRFLRVTLRLLVEGEDHAVEIEEDEILRARVRSVILELLTLQTAAHLTTSEGKAALKASIAERASHAIAHTKVTDVLFTEFVVQF